MTETTLRRAEPRDYPVIANLTVDVYRGLWDRDIGEYEVQLRDVAGRAADPAAEVYVAVDASGSVVGSVTFAAHGSEYAEQCTGGEAVFRMLVVAPGARGTGVGRSLVQLCIDRAGELGLRRLRLSTQTFMVDARRLYERMGFTRTPDRDWGPRPGIDLLTYAVDLR